MSRTQSATLVIGAEISEKAGEKLGHIEDLIVDLKSGLVIYAIISFDQKRGAGNKYFPIPVKAIKESSSNDEKIILDIDMGQLNDAPSFSKKNWPKGYEEDFVQTVYNHYGYKISER